MSFVVYVELLNNDKMWANSVILWSWKFIKQKYILTPKLKVYRLCTSVAESERDILVMSLGPCLTPGP